MSLIARTVKGDVNKRVVIQRQIISAVLLFAEHLLSEHFAEQQSSIVIPGHVVVYLPG